MCKIEHGKKISGKGGRPPKYPYRKMDVGDSFSIPNKNTSDISGSLNHANKTLYPKNFKAGVIDDDGKRILKNGVPAVRVVRIA